MYDPEREKVLTEIQTLLKERPPHIRIDDLEVLLSESAAFYGLARTNYSRRVISRLLHGEFCPKHRPGNYMIGYDQAKRLLAALKRTIAENKEGLLERAAGDWRSRNTGLVVKVLHVAKNELTDEEIVVFRTPQGRVLWSATFDRDYARQ